MKKTLLSLAAVLVAITVTAQDYYIAGNGSSDANKSFCDGKNWDPAGSKMNGTNPATITYTNVAAGTYEFKVTDGTWSNAWGGGAYTGEVVEGIVATGDNLKFTIPLASDITITFDGENKKIIGLASSNGFGKLVINIYTVVGDAGLCGTEMDPTNTANDMTLSGSVWEKIYTGIAANTYRYKVVGNHDWAAYEYPGSNQNQEAIVTEENSTLLITFDPSVPVLEYVILPPSSIGNAEKDAELSAVNGTVYCSADTFTIYNTMGLDITTQNGNLSGICIVKYAGKAKMILVK